LAGRGQKLRKDKATAEIELHGLVPALAERGPSEDRQRPDRPLADLAALRDAPPELKRRMFAASARVGLRPARATHAVSS
jgi:hypothetical protein